MRLAHLVQEDIRFGAHEHRVIEFRQQTNLLNRASLSGGQLIDQRVCRVAALGDGDYLGDCRSDLGKTLGDLQLTARPSQGPVVVLQAQAGLTEGRQIGHVIGVVVILGLEPLQGQFSLLTPADCLGRPDQHCNVPRVGDLPPQCQGLFLLLDAKEELGVGLLGTEAIGPGLGELLVDPGRLIVEFVALEDPSGA